VNLPKNWWKDISKKMSILPSFEINLDEKIQPNTFTIGNFLHGERPCFAAATRTQKIFVYDPRATNGPKKRYLNINRSVSSLTSGRLLPDGKDSLIVGLHTDLLAYDVERNREIFFKDVPDGANVVACKRNSKNKSAFLVVGGNCTVQGLDGNGEEMFWTVTGDNVSALTLDPEKEGRYVVGSEDYEIRRFKQDELRATITENDVVTQLCYLDSSSKTIGYGLKNGTIGVYQGERRRWRIKSKHKVLAMCAFDLNGDGVDELITGWSNGRLDVRDVNTGRVIYREKLSDAVTALKRCDFRGNGEDHLVCCTVGVVSLIHSLTQSLTHSLNQSIR